MAPRGRKPAFTMVALLIMALLGLLLLEGVLRATAVHGGNATFLFGKRWYYLAPVGIPDEMPDVSPVPGAYRSYDASLGWSVRPLGRGDDPNLYGKGDPEIYFSNEHGYRCNRASHERALTQWAGKELPATDTSAYDFVCIGDSFTHGDAVPAEQSWPSYLAELASCSVANLGVGGYGIDQAVMRYETKNPRCRLVLLGLIAGDLERATSLVYNFTYGDLKSKPLYEFSGNAAAVFNRPALHGEALLVEYQAGPDSTFFSRARFTWDPRLMTRGLLDFSYCCRILKTIPLWRADRARIPIYLEDGERLAYCVRILQHLKAVATAREAGVTVVLLGEGNSFSHKASSGGVDNWALLKAKLKAAGIPSIDTTPALHAMFQQEPGSVINAGDGVHYTPEANLRVAEVIADALADRR